MGGLGMDRAEMAVLKPVKALRLSATVTEERAYHPERPLLRGHERYSALAARAKFKIPCVTPALNIQMLSGAATFAVTVLAVPVFSVLVKKGVMTAQ